MSTLYISEYSGYAVGGLQVAQEPSLAEQTVAISGSSTQSSAFSANTRLVRIESDVVCSVQFGASPTATTSMKRVAASEPEYFVVSPGSKVAAISNT